MYINLISLFYMLYICMVTCFFNQNVIPINIHWIELSSNKREGERVKFKWMAHTHLQSSCRGEHTCRESGKKGWCLPSLTAALVINTEEACRGVQLVAVCLNMHVCSLYLCRSASLCATPPAPSHRGLAYTSPSQFMWMRYYLFQYEWCCPSDLVHPGIPLPPLKPPIILLAGHRSINRNEMFQRETVQAVCVCVGLCVMEGSCMTCCGVDLQLVILWVSCPKDMKTGFWQ